MAKVVRYPRARQLKLDSLPTSGPAKAPRCRRVSEAKEASRLAHADWLEWTRSVWGFKATESTAKTGLHPAQFSAVLPRRLVRLYSFVGELVLDPFVGMGTTLHEAWRAGRRSLGVDVNPDFVQLVRQRVDSGFPERQDDDEPLDEEMRPIVVQGDARDVSFISDDSVQLIVTHPPYWNAVRISSLEDDLSNVSNEDYALFLANMRLVFQEMHRVLEPDRVAAVVTGDVMRRVNGVTQLHPLHADYIFIARDTGFVLWDLFIWETKIRESGGKPMMGSYPYPHKLFSQFAHNYILIFRKSA